MSSSSQILNHDDIILKIERVAWEILENNHKAKELILLGIAKRGETISQLIANSLKTKSDLSIHIGSITVNKDSPLVEPVLLESPLDSLQNKVVIIIDDVLNSGKTMSAAFAEVLTHDPKKINIAVLADRAHKRFPVKADFVGISLATTTKEHISFQEKGGQMQVVLK